MTVSLEYINSVPTENLELPYEFKQWVTNLVDSLNTTIGIIEQNIGGGGGGGLTWLSATGTVSGLVNYGYVATSGSLVTINLPATCALGDIVRVVGFGTGGWEMIPAAGQDISIINITGTTSVASSSRFDALELVCTVADTSWVAGSLMTTGVTLL